MKLLNGYGCRFPDPGGNEGFPEMIDYDSRRTGNGSLDAGSTPAYSTKSKASVSKKRKITALYVAKVIYNAVIFMI